MNIIVDVVLNDRYLAQYHEMLLSEYPDITSLAYEPHALKCVSSTLYSSDDIKTAIDNFSPVTAIYNADTLISWALSQGFAADIMQHMAAFLDFANKATVASKNNFLAYATAVDLVDTANAIISKAIELGARL